MKLNKYFSTLLGGLVLVGAWSCTDKIEPTPSPAFDGADVYFSTTQSTEVAILENATEVSVDIFRVKADDDQTVALTTSFSAEDEEGNIVPIEGIFTAPETVTFAKGEKKVAYPVAVDFSKVEPGVDYYMSVKIEGDLTSSYGDAEKVFTLTYSEWTEWEWYETPSTLIQYVLNGGLGDDSEAGNLSPAELEAATDDNGNYILLAYRGQIVHRTSLINDKVEMYGIGGPRYSNFAFNFIFTVDYDKMIDVNGEQYPLVTMESVGSGYDYNGMEILVADCRTSLSEFFAPGSENFESNWERLGLQDSYYNTKTGVFHVFVMEYTEAGNILSYDESFFYLPGFNDYSMNFSYLGNFVNKAGVENAVINISRSEDVTSFVYGIKQGALTDEQVKAYADELAEDTELELIYDASYDVMIPLSEDGKYTLVTVAYDKAGSVVDYDSYTFDFKSVQKESMWVSAGVAGYTDGIMDTFYNNYLPDTYEVEIEQHKENANLYRLVNPLEPFYTVMDPDYFIATGTPGYIYFDITNPDNVLIYESPLGFSCPGAKVFGDEELMLVDPYIENDADVLIALGANGTLEDGVITFPGTFSYNGSDRYIMWLTTETMWDGGNGGGYGTNAEGTFEIIMPDADASYIAAKKAKYNGHKNLVKKTSFTKADRSFLNSVKAKSAKAAKRMAELKEFKESRLNNSMSIR